MPTSIILIEVGQANSQKEQAFAEKFFTSEMARAMGFDGYRSRQKEEINDTLKYISNEFPALRLAVHANIALAMPLRKRFKYVDFKRNKVRALRPKKLRALTYFEKALKDEGAAIATLGFTDYRYYFQVYQELKKDQ